MRRMILLLTTMALALLLAAGVALAATVTCQVGVTCKGTSSADTITGTTSNDTINGLAGNDTINALGGIDKINGGTQNDTMDGGAANDSYRFSNNLGVDSISADSAGVDTIDFSRITTSGVTFGLTGPTTCPPTQPVCIALGGNFIENLIGTGFNDSLSGNTLKNQITGGGGNDFMNGQTGNDTYKYGTGPASGVDNINDTAGSPDKLNLTSFNKGCGAPGCEPLFSLGIENDNLVHHLIIDFADGSSIRLLNYFDGTTTPENYCASGPGPGLIETIIFADDPNVDFAQVLSDPDIGDCGPPVAGAASTGSVQDQPQGSIQAIVLETPEPSPSSATSVTPLTRAKP
jgi:hypothetical protein